MDLGSWVVSDSDIQNPRRNSKPGGLLKTDDHPSWVRRMIVGIAGAL